MIYVQFYRTPCLGDGVESADTLSLSERYSPRRMGAVAMTECMRRGYDAWRVFNGDKPISQLWFVSDVKPVIKPVWLSAHGM